MNELYKVYKLEKIILEIRKFFSHKQFTEVITPLLHTQLPLEPTIYPFLTQHGGIRNKQPLYLAPSPEKTLKKLLSFGLGNCFAISKSFRNLEMNGSLNTCEFLMLEWYRKNADSTSIMKDVFTLVHFLNDKLKNPIVLNSNWPLVSFITLFQKHLDVNLSSLLEDKNMLLFAKKKGLSLEKHPTWEQLFNQLYLNFLYPKLSLSPYFLTDFPSRISQLCKEQDTNSGFAQRFELVINGIEIANGNTESTDEKKINTYMNEEETYRKKNNLIYAPRDTSFMSSLKKLRTSGILFAGAGLGIERLLMVLMKKRDLREVVLQTGL